MGDTAAAANWNSSLPIRQAIGPKNGGKKLSELQSAEIFLTPSFCHCLGRIRQALGPTENPEHAETIRFRVFRVFRGQACLDPWLRLRRPGSHGGRELALFRPIHQAMGPTAWRSKASERKGRSGTMRIKP